jgi:hypothetical protein
MYTDNRTVTGSDALRHNLNTMGMLASALCRKCGGKEDFSYHTTVLIFG